MEEAQWLKRSKKAAKNLSRKKKVMVPSLNFTNYLNLTVSPTSYINTQLIREVIILHLLIHKINKITFWILSSTRKILT